MANLNISKLRYVFLSVNISGVYIALGLLISLQPPFYPSEAEKMGATPAEYGFVFGIANLSLFLFSPVFGAYATRIGPKTCFNCGAVLQGVSGFLFAFLPYCSTTGLFIGLSYLLRFLEGLGKSKHFLKLSYITLTCFKKWEIGVSHYVKKSNFCPKSKKCY